MWKSLVIILLLQLHQSTCAIKIRHFKYRKVVLSEDEIGPGKDSNTWNYDTYSETLIGGMVKEYEERDGIHTLCKTSDDKTYKLVYGLQVSPQYTSATPEVTCYTDLEPDLAFGGTTLIGPGDYINDAPRIASHLLDGINKRKHDLCTEVANN